MVEASGDRCPFTFDPAEWRAENGQSSPLDGKLLNEDGVWRCPHDAPEGADRCLFHQPVDAKDDRAVEEALLSKIDTIGKEPKQFIGARFGTLDLDHRIIECGDNHKIDLRHARFEGETNLRYAIVRQPLSLEGALFQQRPICTEVTFEGEVYLSKATFAEPVRFVEAEFAAGVWGYKTTFAEANFHMARFGGPVDFSEATFDKAHFREAEFETVVRFKLTTFSHATFSGSRFGDRVYFDQATVPHRVNLQKTVIGASASFEDLDLADGSCCIDLRETAIPDGRLYLPEHGTLVYDLTSARLGNVELADGEPPTALFDHFRLLHTTFDGFDFGSYREALHSAEWCIHDVVEIPGLEATRPPSDGDLESTYLKAKNGANEIGDTKAAAEFFRREMLYRREQYWPTVLDPSEPITARIAAAGRWGANTLLNLTAGYGERPSRVIGVSVGTILVFSGLFAIAQPIPPYEMPIGYLILSLESFITLVLGGAEDVGSPWIRLLAQIEGFVGAFLIALFVFTLTRSIHR
ncbi:pentapeptide repeat-containing protein [Haloplanus aerogenes]|uniref:Pentapeptide repeat protein n=1 Tax=Haloplanus aerogenes TaxID=660522 RepID=A0A3M0CY90_9EURY|nr:pentapeptide repeat-containing protein [Haloplanus aerogenes]AZH25103.1 hypothetical protein DU502_06810 [Haloplanus aerogenes]RMB13675.1 pentapeptide repeat protein [Haloplanus aerogenes]